MDTVSLGSVNGLVGHTETASGIISLIKVLLMINQGTIPPQASFRTLSSAIKASTEDNIEVPRSLKAWKIEFRAALINNYGASGSNASMVVTQAPRVYERRSKDICAPRLKFPFWLAGYDDQSLRAYASRLRLYLCEQKSLGKDVSLAEIAFNVSRQSNRTLKHALLFSTDPVQGIEDKLAAFDAGDPRVAPITCPPARPIILCFGGQVSTFVGLEKQLHNNVTVLRRHLNECNSILEARGVESIYPRIFS